ncbi:hypothetical protein Tco_0494297 [Tanacetum coccineum]
MAALQYKDDHNRIAYLGRERGSEDFTDILSYLDHLSILRLKWAGEEIPLTPPMLAMSCCCAMQLLMRHLAAPMISAGSTAEAHPAPHSPPFSPVRESTPERQPETEWVVPNPVSPGTNWRPWPSVPAPRHLPAHSDWQRTRHFYKFMTAKLDRCTGEIDSIGNRAREPSKKFMGELFFATLVSRVKKFERTKTELSRMASEAPGLTIKKLFPLRIWRNIEEMRRFS